MASVMPDAQTYLLTGARINLTLLHLCSCFSRVSTKRGKKSGSLGPETVAGFFFISDFEGEGNIGYDTHLSHASPCSPCHFPLRPGLVL